MDDMSEGVQMEIKRISYHWHDRASEPRPGSTDFAGSVQVLIGEVGDESADSFDIQVLSPSRLAQLDRPDVWADEALPGGNIWPITGLWLMRSWDKDELERAIRRLIVSCGPGPDFGAVADRIGRLMPWEFDYAYDDRVNREAGLADLRGGLWHDSE
jgi:hypothetical protein